MSGPKKGESEREREEKSGSAGAGAGAAEEREGAAGAGAGAGDGEELAEDSSRDMQQQSKALDSITDHVEERQLDSRRVEQAMATIAASAEEAKAAQTLKERELASVRINASHVDVIAAELDVEKKQAEQRLREYKGDAVAAIRSFLH